MGPSTTARMDVGPQVSHWKVGNAKPFMVKPARQLAEKLKAGSAWEDHDYVFCASIGTHLNPTRDILDQLEKLLAKAGLPAIRFHDLRHIAATAVLALGTNPKIVQEILGHSAIAITMDVYSHVLPTMQKEAMNKLNEALQG